MGAPLLKGRRLHRHVTYSNVVATLCLVVVTGAGAHAAGLGRNTVGSAQIKNGQVMAPDLASNAVTGAKVRDNSLTGADVDERTLTGVRASSAVEADTVGGVKVSRVDFRVPTGTPATSVFVLPGVFRLDASCQTFGDQLDITAFTGVDAAYISIVTTEIHSPNDSVEAASVSSTSRDTFDIEDAFEVDAFEKVGDSEIRLHYKNPGGTVIDMSLFRDFTGSTCSLTGVATQF